MVEIRKVRVFVSSPDDVGPERDRIEIAAGRLNLLFAERVKIETVRWETELYSSHQHFQEKIPEASECDLVIATFWSRLGTPMPGTYRMENGERYPSGSAYEVLTAIEARKKRQRPDVYVFRKIGAPANPEEDTRAQWVDLSAFFARWFQAPDGEYLRAYYRFETTDEFERLVEKLLRKWVEDNVPRDRSLIWPIETKGSPFRSLQPFDPIHSVIFFGRDRKVTRAVEHLQSVALPRSEARSRPRNVPFLLIVGESGAGKSSLMRAGVAPRLTTPGVTPRVDLWRVAVARIGDDPDPFLTLAKALLVEDDKIGGFGPALPQLGRPEQAQELAEILARGGTGGPRKRTPAARPILQALRQVQDREQRRRNTKIRQRANLLLLVDQLENIFAAKLDEAARSAFARLLFALAATRRVWIIATLRSDLYPRLITPGDFLALKDAGAVYDLAAPGESELTEIVHKSAAAGGLVYGLSSEGGERLDERILRDAQGKNTLPLLQFALDSLFQAREVVGAETQLTFAAYEKIGGLDGAIDKAAEAALTNLSKEEQDALPRLLRALAVPMRDKEAKSAGGELTVRTLPYATAAPDAATQRLVDALVLARIVVVAGEEADGSDGDAFISIAHQRVFESWKRAREIIADHRDFFRIRDDVGRQLSMWERSGKKSDYLLSRGVPLAEGQKILNDYGPELDPGMRGFISASSSRAQRLIVFLATVAASFAVIAIGAIYFYLDSRANLRMAQKNFEVATKTADNVVSSFSRGLADVKSVGVKTIDRVLHSVNDAFAELWETNRDDPLLRRSRANMAYQFATNYEKVKDPKSMEEADNQAHESLQIREEIAHYPPSGFTTKSLRQQPPEVLWELSQSFELVGDVLRLERKLNDAQTMFAQSRDLLKAMLVAYPGKSDWALSLSRAYTTMGDVDAMQMQDYPAAQLKDDDPAQLRDHEKHYYGAQLNYAALMEIDSEYFLSNAGTLVWRREFSWAFSKTADLTLTDVEKFAGSPDREVRIRRALDGYSKALCLRRMLAEGEKDDNTKISRDVASTFERVADAESMLSERPQQEEALIASLGIRRELVKDDEADSGYVEDLAATYEKLGAFYGTGSPTTEDASRSTEFSAAFYQAALRERRRALVLRGNAADAQKNLEATKLHAEQSLAAATAGGMFADVSGGWWATRIADAESRVATPRPVDSPACIAIVTQAARATAHPTVAKLDR
jgi:eukaryotic-like serine/threonine-protein kinase